jgi:hypothetical protein
MLKKCKKSPSRSRVVAEMSCRLPMLHGKQKQKTLPMQHGKANTHFCDTSQVGRSISQIIKFLLLLILVDLGSNNKHPRWEFVGKVENDEKT